MRADNFHLSLKQQFILKVLSNNTLATTADIHALWNQHSAINSTTNAIHATLKRLRSRGYVTDKSGLWELVKTSNNLNEENNEKDFNCCSTDGCHYGR